MQNFDLENADCHAKLGMIEKRWGFPRRTLRALLGMTKSGQSGRSMIEMLGVLAIVGVLSVGGIAGYSKAMHRYRVNKTIEQITYMAGAIRSFFGPQKSYRGVERMDVLKKARLVPDEMWESGKWYPQSVWGDVSPFAIPKVWDNACPNDSICSTQAFVIEYQSLPEEACIDLITQDWSNVGVSMIWVYNPDNPTFGNHNAFIIPPVSLDHAIKICEVPATDINGIYQVRFGFDHDVTKGDMATEIANTLATLNGS